MNVLAKVLTGVLVLAAVGGGVTYTAVTVEGANRTAPLVPWAEPTAAADNPDPAAGIFRGRASTPLSKLLLPVPTGYELGSDIEGYGNDGELGARESAGLLKATGKGVYGKKRREYEKNIEALGIQGMAVRSYAATSGDLQVETLVWRMKDKKAVKAFFGLGTELSDLVGLEKGPKVKGHARDASCHVLPQDSATEEKEADHLLRGMVCRAYSGEVLLNFVAYGAEPLDQKAVAELVEQQLGHIASPGEYV